MGKKAPDSRKYWAPTDDWVTDFDTFMSALAETIETSHPKQNAAYALGTYSPEISNFKRGKAVGTGSSKRADNLIKGLRAERPAEISFFEATPRVLAFWDNNRSVREDLADRLERQREERLSAAVDLEDRADPQPGPPMPAGPVPNRPKLDRVVAVRCSLDESHNLGSPEQPALLVQLTYGSGEPNPPGTPEGAVLRLADCHILVQHDAAAAIVEPGYGGETVFRLALAGQQSEITFRREGVSGQEWRSVHGKAGRRLCGQSDYELLCRFSRRPGDLSVKVQARHTDFRLDRPGRDSRDFDEVDRVIGALARIYTLGRSDAGYVELDSSSPSA